MVSSPGARASEKGTGGPSHLVSSRSVGGRTGASSTRPPEAFQLPLPSAPRTHSCGAHGSTQPPSGEKEKGEGPTQLQACLRGGLAVSPFPSTHCSPPPSPGHHPCSWGHCPSLPSHVPHHPPVLHMAASVPLSARHACWLPTTLSMKTGPSVGHLKLPPRPESHLSLKLISLPSTNSELWDPSLLTAVNLPTSEPLHMLFPQPEMPFLPHSLLC